ncbi:capping complex subunit for YIEGIA [Bacillus sp. 179-C3.3 HS]|uniref:capping complex subunit for YIEGIA n=1 Tax=Bacillus sp. 179-C3.3 HS TaxID=3232162 RepID=UPI0039A26CD5
MGSKIEQFILAVATTNKQRVMGGTAVFFCKNKEELDMYAMNLEAILDGIAHAIGEDLYLIVKHF